VEELAEALALELPGGERYTDLLLAAQRQMADETVQLAVAGSDGEVELLDLAGRLRQELAAAMNRRTAAPVIPATVRRTAELDSRRAGRGPISSTSARRQAAASAACAVAEPHSGLPSRVAAAVQRCRHARQPLSLALF